MTSVCHNNADEFLDFCEHNFRVLADNLTSLGYRFRNSNGPLGLPGYTRDELSSKIEKSQLSSSLLLKWYSRFQYVDFAQCEDQMYDAEAKPICGLGYNLVFRVVDLDSCFKLRGVLAENGFRVFANGKTLLPFGAYASNCEAKGVWMPPDDFDPVIYNEGNGPVTFSQELIDAFACGGFPFWDRLTSRRRIRSPIGHYPDYQELKSILTKGITAW